MGFIYDVFFEKKLGGEFFLKGPVKIYLIHRPGKISEKKYSLPLFLSKKVFAPYYFSELQAKLSLKSSPPILVQKKILAPFFISTKDSLQHSHETRRIAPFFTTSSFESWFLLFEKGCVRNSLVWIKQFLRLAVLIKMMMIWWSKEKWVCLKDNTAWEIFRICTRTNIMATVREVLKETISIEKVLDHYIWTGKITFIAKTNCFS